MPAKWTMPKFNFYCPISKNSISLIFGDQSIYVFIVIYSIKVTLSCLLTPFLTSYQKWFKSRDLVETIPEYAVCRNRTVNVEFISWVLLRTFTNIFRVSSQMMSAIMERSEVLLGAVKHLSFLDVRIHWKISSRWYQFLHYIQIHFFFFVIIGFTNTILQILTISQEIFLFLFLIQKMLNILFDKINRTIDT